MLQAIREILCVTITTFKPIQPKHSTQYALLGYLVSILKQELLLDLAATWGGLINDSLQQQRLGSS